MTVTCRFKGGGHLLRDYPDVLTVKQVAEVLCICEKSVYRLLDAHSIGFRRVGRKYLVPKQCVAEYLSSARYMVKR